MNKMMAGARKLAPAKTMMTAITASSIDSIGAARMAPVSCMHSNISDAPGRILFRQAPGAFDLFWRYGR